MNRDEVISGLEKCAASECNEKCPYNGINYGCRPRLMLDAAELLKEQEPVKPEQQESPGGAWWYKCGNCQTAISPGDNYCRGCGRVIDWSK